MRLQGSIAQQDIGRTSNTSSTQQWQPQHVLACLTAGAFLLCISAVRTAFIGKHIQQHPSTLSCNKTGRALLHPQSAVTHLYVSNCGLPLGPSNSPSSPSRSQNTTSPPGVCSRLAVKSIRRTLQQIPQGNDSGRQLSTKALLCMPPSSKGQTTYIHSLKSCEPQLCSCTLQGCRLAAGPIWAGGCSCSTHVMCICKLFVSWICQGRPHLAPSARTRMVQPLSRAVMCVSCGGLSMMLPQCRSLCSNATASSATARAKAVCSKHEQQTQPAAQAVSLPRTHAHRACYTFACTNGAAETDVESAHTSRRDSSGSASKMAQ